MNDCWVRYYNTTLVVGERIYLDMISPVALWSYGDVQAELETEISQLGWKKHAYSVNVCVCVCERVCVCVCLYACLSVRVRFIASFSVNATIIDFFSLYQYFLEKQWLDYFSVVDLELSLL